MIAIDVSVVGEGSEAGVGRFCRTALGTLGAGSQWCSPSC